MHCAAAWVGVTRVGLGMSPRRSWGLLVRRRRLLLLVRLLRERRRGGRQQAGHTRGDAAAAAGRGGQPSKAAAARALQLLPAVHLLLHGVSRGPGGQGGRGAGAGSGLDAAAQPAARSKCPLLLPQALRGLCIPACVVLPDQRLLLFGRTYPLAIRPPIPSPHTPTLPPAHPPAHPPTWIMKEVSLITSAQLGRMCGSWCQHFVMRRRRGSGQSGSTQGRSPLMATCGDRGTGSGKQLSKVSRKAGAEQGGEDSRRAAYEPTPATSAAAHNENVCHGSQLAGCDFDTRLEDDLEEVGGVPPGLAPRVALVQDDAQRIHVHLCSGEGRQAELDDWGGQEGSS